MTDKSLRMKFNWGYKITVVYLVFVAGIMYLVVQASKQDVDLVTQDYYGEEIRYQERIDQRARAEALSEPIRYEMADQAIHIRFPREFAGKEITGEVLLYYPADSKRDVRTTIRTISNDMTLRIPDARSGMHILQVKWEADRQSYYFEENLFIP
jgi:hypothetical protein